MSDQSRQIGPAQRAVMEALATEGPSTHRQISDETCRTQSSVWGVLRVLLLRGLVVREEDSSPYRYLITEAGEEVIEWESSPRLLLAEHLRKGWRSPSEILGEYGRVRGLTHGHIMQRLRALTRRGAIEVTRRPTPGGYQLYYRATRTGARQ